MIGIFLSIIFPGLGQLYYGKTMKGLLMIGLTFIPFAYPIILIWSIYDCIKLRDTVKVDPLRRKEAIWVIVFGLIIIPVFSTIVIIGTIRLITNYTDKVVNYSDTNLEMIEIASHIKQYKTINKKYPDEIRELIGNRPLRKSWLTDKWRNPYIYEKTNNGFMIKSAGKDKKFDTEDDLIIIE